MEEVSGEGDGPVCDGGYRHDAGVAEEKVCATVYVVYMIGNDVEKKGHRVGVFVVFVEGAVEAKNLTVGIHAIEAQSRGFGELLDL